MTTRTGSTRIAQVMVSHSTTNNEMMVLKNFLKISLGKRHELIRERRVEFIDFDGEKIPLLEALRAITELVQKLRTEGGYSNYLNKA